MPSHSLADSDAVTLIGKLNSQVEKISSSFSLRRELEDLRRQLEERRGKMQIGRRKAKGRRKKKR